MRDDSTRGRSPGRSPLAFSQHGVAIAGACAAAIALIAACSSSSAPGGTGDRLVVDTRGDGGSAPPPPPPPTDAMTFPSYDGYSAPDGYSPFNACKACACPGTDFCVGGISGMTTVTSCPSVPGMTTLKAGCNVLPAACAAKPDCACLIEAVKGQFPCYPVCSDLVGGFTLYCPVP